MPRPATQHGRTCEHCHKRPCRSKGLCGPCNTYLRRHGSPRPLDMPVRAGGRPGAVRGRRCLCGSAAVGSVDCPAGKVYLCRTCTEKERKQARL